MSPRILLVLGATLVSFSTAALADHATVLDTAFSNTIRRAAREETKAVLHAVPVAAGDLVDIELVPMKVWADDAQILVHGRDGNVTALAPSEAHFLKGTVPGDPGSTVFIKVDALGRISGVILARERKLILGTGRRIGRLTPQHPEADEVADDGAPLLLDEVESFNPTQSEQATWTCALDQVAKFGSRFVAPGDSAGTPAAKRVVANGAGALTGVSYTLRVAVDTDNELYAAFGSTQAVTDYITQLVGFASTIYQRDLATTLQLGNLSVWQAADPYTVTPPADPNLMGQALEDALGEFGTYWHNNHGDIARSSAVLVSGRGFSAGIAWGGDQQCANDFPRPGVDGQYGGGYAFCGSFSGLITTTNPDPSATVNGVAYALPNNNNFWMLFEFAHELGHNVNGPHTHCIALTTEEKASYGTPLNYVDECYNAEGDPVHCFSGTSSNGQACAGSPPYPSSQYCLGGVPPELGTLMGYCHNLFVGSYRQSRYVIGEPGKPSEKVLAYFRTALNASTADPTITYADAAPISCSAGRTASVPSCAGCTYSWAITGGTITAGSAASTVTFTPGGATVTLSATVTTAKGCGITYSLARSTSCGSATPPTNVAALASGSTSVAISWTAAAGVTGYRVMRSTNGVSWTQVGADTAAGTTSVVDGTVSSNTAYLYLVRSLNGSTVSSDSNRDLATTVPFTALVATATNIAAAHITQLRTAVNAVQTLAGIANTSYTDNTLTPNVTPVRRAHIQELRDRLDAARQALGLGALAIATDPLITATSTRIQKAHMDELRAGVQ